MSHGMDRREQEPDLESFLLGGGSLKPEPTEDFPMTELHGRVKGDVNNLTEGDFPDPFENQSKFKEPRQFDVESRKGSEALFKGLVDWSGIWGGSRYSGTACMAISAAGYSLMGLFVKLLAERSFPSSQIIMVRCALISIVAGLNLRQARHPLLGTPGVRNLVIARGLVGFVALFAHFYSIQLLPLRDATLLNFTSPVFTILMAALFLKESWSSAEALGTFCSFLGVLLVTQPRVVTIGHHNSDESTRDMYMGVGAALVAAAVGALSYIIVRVIGQRGEPPLVSVFSFAAFSTPIAALGTLLQGFKTPNGGEVVMLFMVGLSALIAQVCLTRALQLEKACVVAPSQYLKVLFTIILGVIFLHEIPTAWHIAGAVLITGSAASISHKSAS